MVAKRIIIIILVISLVINNKPETKVIKDTNLENMIKDKGHKIRDKLIKICETKEECRDCYFEELKHQPECQNTGQKLLKLCNLYDGLTSVDDYYVFESCYEGLKINSVMYLFIFFTFVAAISLYVRKYYRKILLNYTLEKLNINKDQ